MQVGSRLVGEKLGSCSTRAPAANAISNFALVASHLSLHVIRYERGLARLRATEAEAGISTC